jgi:hypothetical protein
VGIEDLSEKCKQVSSHLRESNDLRVYKAVNPE